MVEVTSANSTQRDRVKKRREYLEVPSLWYYLIVAQHEMLAELHSRNDEENWIQRYFTEPDDRIELVRCDLDFPLSAVYARLKEVPSAG